jgi:hypothetical protein
MAKTIITVITVVIFFMTLFVGTKLQAFEVKEALEKGKVDFDYLKSKQIKVETNITGPLIDIVANIMSKPELKEDPNLSKMLLDLKGTFVKASASEEMAKDIEDVVKHYGQKLFEEGWEMIVRVRDKKDNVMISMLTEQNLIRGIFVTKSSKNELVMVNLFGNINLENIANLAKDKLPIPGKSP